MNALRLLLARHKARIARLTALAGVLTVGLLLLRGAPHPVEVEVVLGAHHAEVSEVRIEYLQNGEELHGVELSFPSGAPARVRHSVSLPAGDFEVRAETRRADGAALASAETALHAPVSGKVLITVPEQSR